MGRRHMLHGQYAEIVRRFFPHVKNLREDRKFWRVTFDVARVEYVTIPAWVGPKALELALEMKGTTPEFSVRSNGDGCWTVSVALHAEPPKQQHP